MDKEINDYKVMLDAEYWYKQYFDLAYSVDANETTKECCKIAIDSAVNIFKSYSTSDILKFKERISQLNL